MKITVIAYPKPVGKKLWLENGRLEKDVAPFCSGGSYQVLDIPPTDFEQFINNLTSFQAFTLGYPKEDKGFLVKKGFEKDGFISRSNDYFKSGEDTGLCLLDYDDDTENYTPPERLIEIITAIAPSFAHCWKLVRRSSSAGVFNDQGKQVGSRGYHIFFEIQKASDLKRFGDVLFKRLWLAGHGRIKIANDGQPLPRTLIDGAVFSPERPIFAGAPILGAGLFKSVYTILKVGGGAFDTRQVKSLAKNKNKNEETTFKHMVKTAKAAYAKESAEVAKRFSNDRALYVSRRKGITPFEARKIVAPLLKGGIHIDSETEIAGRGFVSIRQLLKEGDSVYCSDPLQPEKGPYRARFNPRAKTVYSFISNSEYKIVATPRSKVKTVEDVRPIGDVLLETMIHIYQTGRNALFKSPAGSGKTETALAALIECHNPTEYKHIEFYAPTIDLCNEKKGKVEQGIRGIGCTTRVILGRDQIDPKSTINERMCKRHKVAAEVIKAGLSVEKTLCNDLCPFYKDCPYQEQNDLPAPLTCYPSVHLALPKPSRSRIPSIVVMDENALNGLCRTVIVTTEHIRSAPLATDIKTFLIGLLINGSGPFMDLLKNHCGNDSDEVTRYLDSLSHARDMFKALGAKPEIITPSMTDEQITQILSEYTKQPRHKEVYRLLKQITAQPDTVYIENSVSDGNLQNCFSVSWRINPMKRFGPNTQIICLDATGNEQIFKQFFPDSDFYELKAPRKAHIKQVHNGTFSERSLMGNKHDQDPLRAENIKAAKKRASVLSFVCSVASQHKRLLVITYKSLLNGPWKGELPENIMTAHWGGFRGLDGFKDCDAVVIVGRFQAPITAYERTARAVFAGTDTPIISAPNYDQEHTDLNGVVVSRSVHPDPRVQAIIDMTREGETVQAVDRLRLIHCKEPKHVYIISNLPTELEPDEVVRWQDLMPEHSTASKAEAFFKRFGFVTSSPSIKHRMANDLFPSLDIAKKDKLLKCQGGISIINSTLALQCWQVKPKGKGAHWSDLWAPENATAQQLQDLLDGFGEYDLKQSDVEENQPHYPPPDTGSLAQVKTANLVTLPTTLNSGEGIRSLLSDNHSCHEHPTLLGCDSRFLAFAPSTKDRNQGSFGLSSGHIRGGLSDAGGGRHTARHPSMAPTP